MTALEAFNNRHKLIKAKLKTITLPTDGSATQMCWHIGTTLNVSGPTVKNYICGDIKDGYLGEAIYTEFKRLKFTK